MSYAHKNSFLHHRSKDSLAQYHLQWPSHNVSQHPRLLRSPFKKKLNTLFPNFPLTQDQASYNFLSTDQLRQLL